MTADDGKSDEPRFKPHELLLAAALASGQRLGEAAKAVGISQRTAERSNAKPEFRRHVDELARKSADETARRVVSILSRCSEVAAEKLLKVLEMEHRGYFKVHLAAVRIALHETPKMRDHVELLRRLEQLEAAVAEKEKAK